MKPLLLRLHRWSGLLIAAVVLVVGLTGALTTYQQEVDTWLNPDLLRVEPPSQSNSNPAPDVDASPAVSQNPSLDRIAAAAEASAPGLRATSVRLPQSSFDSIEVSVAAQDAQDFSGRYVYVNPHDGKLLGSRPFDPAPWSRRGIVASLYEVHYSLAASRPGVLLVSFVATVWLLTTCFGVVLAWPRSARDLRRVFRVRFTRGGTPLNHDVHRLTGLLAAPVLLIVLATGIALNLSPQATGLLERFSPLTFEPALPELALETTAANVGWQAALNTAVAALSDTQVNARPSARPGQRPYSLYFDTQRQLYVVRMREADAIHRRGQTRVYISANDASVLAVWNPRAGSAGDRFWSWQNPLHSGHALGAFGRLLVFLSGLAAAIFVVTGVPLWLARRPARKR